MPSLDAIIVAAGASRRMGFDKLFADLGGSTVLARSLAAFETCPDVRRIVVVCPVGREDEFRVETANCRKLTNVVPGGAARSDSVLAGAQTLATCGTQAEDFVAVHDAARPLVSALAISECFRAAKEEGAAALASRVTDTLHRADAKNRAEEVVPREDLWRAETPQIMPLGLLTEAISMAVTTDEVSALLACGRHAKLVPSNTPNFKITTPPDLAHARAVLEAQK